MGVSVREKPKGSGVWWIFIKHQGERKSKRIGTDKRTALSVAKQLQERLALADFKITEDSPTPDFKYYAAHWAEITVKATCKASTASDYNGLLKNHILPVFGQKKVDEIKRAAVKTFLQKKINEGFSPSTVTHMKNAIAGVLNLAVDDEVIPANPAHALGKLSVNIRKMAPKMDPLDRKELAHLLETFGKHFPRDYPLALTLARTGMRLGEGLGLQWGDIDFHGRFITIQRSLSRDRIETPKSGKIRKVDMSQQLTDTLLHLRRQRKEETLRKGWKEVPEWVFVTGTGTHLNGPNWRNRIFNKALEKAGLRRVRIHDLRHTFASLLIQAGESLPYIRDQLGHHSIKVTVDIYGHLSPQGNKEAVDRLDDIAPAFLGTLSAPTK